MYIFRAANELDIEMNPKENGIISKSIYGKVLWKPFNFLVYATFIGRENPCLKMKERDINKLFHEIRTSIGLNFYKNEIISLADNEQRRVNDILRKTILEQESESVRQIVDIFKTKNGHITKGSQKDYPWISFTTDLTKTRHYYEDQNKHEVIVVDSNIEKFVDISEDNFLFALDLSSREKIADNEFIINVDGTRTAINFRGLNYSKSDNEVIYYNKVPKEKVVTILRAIQYELLTSGILPEDYYKMSSLKQHRIQILSLLNMKKILENNGDIFNYLLNKYYIENNSLKSLEKKGEYSVQELREANQKILQKLKRDEEFRVRILS